MQLAFETLGLIYSKCLQLLTNPQCNIFDGAQFWRPHFRGKCTAYEYKSVFYYPNYQYQINCVLHIRSFNILTVAIIYCLNEYCLYCILGPHSISVKYEGLAVPGGPNICYAYNTSAITISPIAAVAACQLAEFTGYLSIIYRSILKQDRFPFTCICNNKGLVFLERENFRNRCSNFAIYKVNLLI